MAVAVPGVGVVGAVMGIATAWEVEWVELMLRIVIHVENKLLKTQMKRKRKMVWLQGAAVSDIDNEKSLAVTLPTVGVE